MKRKSKIVKALPCRSEVESKLINDSIDRARVKKRWAELGIVSYV